MMILVKFHASHNHGEYVWKSILIIIYLKNLKEDSIYLA